ncbi:MAG: DUF308 domain-containing protein [Caldilineaceae bacterium]
MTQPRLPLRYQLPWWAFQLIGVLCLLIGITLTLHPFQSLLLLSRLITVGLLLVGLFQAVTATTASRPWVAVVIGCGWMIAGILSAVWAGLTFHALTIIIGLLLLASGLVKIGVALRTTDERLLLVLGGVANLIFGLLALTAPAATVLVLALLFGIYVGIFGILQMARAFALRTASTEISPRPAQPWSPRWRMAGTVLTLLLALAGLTLSVQLRWAQPAAPGPFYHFPTPLPTGSPGTIIRTEPIANEYADAELYRMLYLSTGYDGQPTAVSGLIIIPTTPPPAAGRPSSHGPMAVVGVAPNAHHP